MTRSLLVAAACAFIGLPAYAQTGTFAGTVARDSMGTAIGNAEVQLPQLNRRVTTNYQGEFRFGEVPAGRYAVVVRAVGFEQFIDSITVKAGAAVDGDIVLTALPVNLDAARTVAAAPETRLPPGIAELEERRKMHMGGFFVTDSMLRANDERKLTYLLARAPRLEEVLSQTGSGIYIAVPGPAPPVPDDPAAKLLPSYMKKTDGTFTVNHCYVNVYLNGARFWSGPPGPFNPPPDFDSMWAREYSGIEYYASTATTPSQYNGTTAWGCGVLLLWTRR
jgi:hypothetical protein